MKLSRLFASREKWKCRAVERGTELRRTNRKLAVLRKKSAEAEAQIEALRTDRDELRAALDAARAAPTPQVPPTWPQVRVVVVLVFAFGLLPCNAVTRCLALLKRVGWLAVERVPNPSSVVNWVARAGLGLLSRVAPAAAPWVAIIDSSISYGKAKMLVVLRVPLAHFALGKGAVTLADVECVGLEIKETWPGEDVSDALTRIFGVAGRPAAILKDQGPDLKRGVALYCSLHKGIAVIRDVGHVAALLLKRGYERNAVFVRFLKLVDAARARLCHGDAAALRPPKIRAKGRFQGISRVVKWANDMAEMLSGSGRHRDGSLRQRLQRAMPGLASMRFFFTRFARDCRALNAAMEVVKNRGLNQETYKLAKTALNDLPVKSAIRRDFTAWLDETMRLQCRLGIEQTPLVVSSDVIESLFGIVKTILERTPV